MREISFLKAYRTIMRLRAVFQWPTDTAPCTLLDGVVQAQPPSLFHYLWNECNNKLTPTVYAVGNAPLACTT